MTLQRRTWVLFVLALLAMAAVVYVFQGDKTTVTGVPGVGEKAFPGLEGQLNSIDQVILSGPEGKTTLYRQNGVWLVAERGDYQADPALVQALVGGLAAAEKSTPKTADTKFFDRLGLVDRFVEISISAGERELAKLKTGDQYYSPTGEGVMTFSFDPVTARAWALSGLPEISVDPSFWLNPELLSLSELRIKKLEVTIGDNPPWVISKEIPKGVFQMEGEDGTRANLKAVNDAALAATTLTFDDTLDPGGLDLLKVAEARYSTFDGLSVDMGFYSHGDDILTSLEASYDASVLEAPDTPSILPDAPPDGAEEAKELNIRWRERLFQIPLDQLAAILKFRSEFFKTQK